MAAKKRNLNAKIKIDGYEYFKREVMIRKLNAKSGIRYQVDLGRLNGPDTSAVRFTFKTLAEARERAQDFIDDRQAVGSAAKALTAAQSVEMATAIGKLAGRGVSVMDCVDYWLSHHEKTTADTNVGAQLDAYVGMKEAEATAGTFRPRSLQSLKNRLKALDPIRDRHIASITEADIIELLKEFKGETRKNRRSAMKTFFTWSEIEPNPVTKRTAFKGKDSDDVAFYSAQDVGKILRKCEELNPKYLPYISLAFFAGIRTAELERMDWSMISLKHNEIRLPSAATKMGRKRTIPIEPCLRSWLEVSGCPTQGPVVPTTLQTANVWRRRIINKAGVVPVANGARHSFGSYGYQHYPLGDLLTYMAHMDSKVLIKHYKGEARKEQAEAYFKLFREKTKVVEFPKAVSA